MTSRKIQSYKAYQVLAHLTYRDHEFFEREKDWIKMTPATTFCRMLKMESKELGKHLKYLREKGYIQDYTHGRGVTSIKMGADYIYNELPALGVQGNVAPEVLTELAKILHRPYGSVVHYEAATEGVPMTAEMIQEGLDKVMYTAHKPGIEIIGISKLSPPLEQLKTFNPYTLTYS